MDIELEMLNAADHGVLRLRRRERVAAALDLFRSGHLQLAYCRAGSLKQIAQRRNARLAQGA